MAQRNRGSHCSDRACSSQAVPSPPLWRCARVCVLCVCVVCACVYFRSWFLLSGQVDFIHPQLAGVPPYVVVQPPGAALWVGALLLCAAVGGAGWLQRGGTAKKSKQR